MSKKVIISITLPKELIAALREEAEKEKRSASNMIAVFIEQGLKRKAA